MAEIMHDCMTVCPILDTLLARTRRFGGGILLYVLLPNHDIQLQPLTTHQTLLQYVWYKGSGYLTSLVCFQLLFGPLNLRNCSKLLKKIVNLQNFNQKERQVYKCKVCMGAFVQ